MAERKMTPRMERLYHFVQDTRMEIRTEKARLFTEAYKKYDGDPDVVRTAKAQAYMLDNISIFLLDDDLMAGYPASCPIGIEADFWTRGCWRPESVKSIREAGSHYISEETEKDMEILADYWQHFAAEYKMLDLFDDKMWAWKKSGYHLPRNKTIEQAAGSGLAVSSLSIFPEQEFSSINYEFALTHGLRQNIEKAKQKLAEIDCWNLKTDYDVDRVYSLRAMIIINEAAIRWANRYADLAEQKAKETDDPARSAWLTKVAASCRRVPEFPCETFLDALHFQWFIYCLCHYMNTMPLARADQFMYPYYKHDIENGDLTEEQAIELLENLRLKYMMIRSTSGGQHRSKWSGNAAWRSVTIGGVKPDGTDATNELSYLFLEAAYRCRTPHHTITLRVHKDTPKELMAKAVELTKTGIGMPSYVGDESYIQTLLDKGVPLEVARDYYITGCLDVTVPEGWGQLFSMCNNALPLDTFLHNGYSPIEDHYVGPKTGDVREMKTFDEFMDKFIEHYKWYINCYAADRQIRFNIRRSQRFLQDVLTISMFSDGVEVGVSPFFRKLPYPGLGPGIGIGVGLVNVGDSLTAIRKLVYDEKKITMDELLTALDSNFEGERGQEIRRMCLACPKYGNDDDYADEMVSEVYRRLSEYINSMDSYRGPGNKYCASSISVTSHEPAGKLVGATPDGRLAGTILADGGGSPVQGMDKNGPTSMLNSALKIHQEKLNALLLNMKFHPNALKSEENVDKFIALIHAYLDNGGKQIQFNVVDAETLKRAQVEPEKNRDLIVRVAGYSAYFTLLSPGVQNEIIHRTTNESV